MTRDTALKLIQRMINLATSYRKEARGHASKATSWRAMNRLRCIQREIPKPTTGNFDHWIAMAAGNVLSVASNSASDEYEAAYRCDQAKNLLDRMFDPTNP